MRDVLRILPISSSQPPAEAVLYTPHGLLPALIGPISLSSDGKRPLFFFELLEAPELWWGLLL